MGVFFWEKEEGNKRALYLGGGKEKAFRKGPLPEGIFWADKLDKARAFGVRIVDEDEFMRMLASSMPVGENVEASSVKEEGPEQPELF